jgi:hypothetical protein
MTNITPKFIKPHSPNVGTACAGGEAHEKSATINIVHDPTFANFWHMEVRWKDQEGNDVSPKQKSAWVKDKRLNVGLRASIKHFIKQYCSVDEEKIT